MAKGDIARQIGSLFVIGFNGVAFSAELRELLDAMQPAGVVLFSRNIENTRQVTELNVKIQEHAWERWGHGIFISVDQEGGRVARLKEPFTVAPPALELARLESPHVSVAHLARRMAEELRFAGFNMDFTPVLDVLGDTLDAEDTVIGDRSFGTDAHMVGKLGAAVIRQMHAQGVIACGKHFPGHGGVKADSHKTLPVDSRPADVLERVDMAPFRMAIGRELGVIMTAHLLYPALDADHPATFSRIILTDILRRRLGFRGVIITDDLEMGAVAHFGDITQAGVAALQAGADLLLVCNSPDKALQVKDAVSAALDYLNAGELETSLRRIRLLRERFSESMRPASVEAGAVYFRA